MELLDPGLLLAQADIPRRQDRAIEGIFKLPSPIGRIFIPAGVYELTAPLIIQDRSIIIEGEGSGITSLIYNGSGAAIIFMRTTGDNDSIGEGAGIHSISIMSTAPQVGSMGVHVDAGNVFTMRDVTVTGFDAFGGCGVYVTNSKNIRMDNVCLRSNGLGLEANGITQTSFSNLLLSDNVTGNALLSNIYGLQWSGGSSDGAATDYGIRIEDSKSVSINGITSELVGSDGYAIETAGNNVNISVTDGYFNITNSPKRFILFESVVGGRLVNNNIIGAGSSDEDVVISNSSGIQLAAQPGTSIRLNNSGSWNSESTNYINVRDFGAIGNGVADDSVAVQNAINSLITSGNRNPIYFPPGTYILGSTIQLPVSIQGLELFGAGWTETDTSTTTLRNTSSGPMFQTVGTGTFANFKCHGFRMLQGVSSGYYFQFDHLTVHMEISRIHCNMSNTAAGCIWMNGVENHMNWIHDMKVVTAGATVPMFWWDGPVTSNMTTCTFQRITCNSPGATTAPQYLIDNKWTTASPGFKWDTINMEQPNGGGIHLYGIAGALMQNVITGDTASQIAPVYLFDKSHTSQSLLEATLIQCNSFIGTQAQPDLVINNSVGGSSPGPVNIIGGRFGWFNPGTFGQIHMTGGTVAGYISGTRPPMRVYSGALLGVKGIGRTHSAVPVNLTRHFSGTATFASSDTLTVNFTAGDLGGADPEADTNYEIIITPTANENIWVDNSSKTTTTFTLKSSNPASTAKVVWMMIRP